MRRGDRYFILWGYYLGQVLAFRGVRNGLYRFDTDKVFGVGLQSGDFVALSSVRYHRISKFYE